MDDVVKGGHELIEASHDQSEVIKAKVDEVSQMWSDLVSSSEVKGVKLQVCRNARTYLQPHYGNGVFGNVYLSAGQH